MTDFNPGNYDQPDHGKEEARTARMGFGLFLIGLFTFSHSVQAFSRVPGTNGPLFIFCHGGSMIMQAWFYEAGVEATGRHDFLGIEVPIIVQAIWLLCSIIAIFYWRLKGFDFEINQLGIGILFRPMLKYSAATVGFWSDMFVAAVFIAGCTLLDSPILARWYYYVTFTLLIGHLWMAYQVQKEMRRLKNARARAEDWAYKINRANWR